MLQSEHLMFPSFQPSHETAQKRLLTQDKAEARPETTTDNFIGSHMTLFSKTAKQKQKNTKKYGICQV